MRALRTRQFRTVRCLSTLFLSACLLASCANNELHQQTSSLAGLKAVDLSDVGPWVLNGGRLLEEMPGLSDEVRQVANERLTGRKLMIEAMSSEKIRNPRLKLILDFGQKQGLALRGHHLKSMKLILEDEVRLERNPPVFVHITSWSSDCIQATGITRNSQIVEAFSQLLDQFINEYREEQARSPGKPDEHNQKAIDWKYLIRMQDRHTRDFSSLSC